MKKLLITIFSLLGSYGAMGQTSHQVVIHIPKSTAIRLKPSTIETTDFNFNTVEKLNSGITRYSAGTYEIRANDQWVVTAKAMSPFFTNSGTSSSVDMPCSVLEIQEGNLSSDFATMTVAEQTIVSGNSGDFGEQNEFNINYKANPGLSYGPGIYVMNVLLTVSAN